MSENIYRRFNNRSDRMVNIVHSNFKIKWKSAQCRSDGYSGTWFVKAKCIESRCDLFVAFLK